MARINIAIPDRFRTPESEAIRDIFISMINDINPLLFSIKDYPQGLPLATRQSLLDEAMRSAQWSITSSGDTWRITGPGIDITRVLIPDSKVLYHKYFELSSKLQNAGIADHVLKASLRITDTLRYTGITLHANLDVGGYAWLRKGAWPQGGVDDLIDSVPGSIKRTNYKLFEELKYKLLGMSEIQARNFVLSQEFRKYKSLFLGADWQGRFNSNDPITRIAMMQGADAAFDALVKNRTVSPPVVLTANEKIVNEFVKHHIRSIGFSSTLARQSQEILDNANEGLQAIILRYVNKLTPPVDFTSAETITLLKEFDKEIYKYRSLIWDDVNSKLTLQLKQYARSEVVFAANVIEGAVPFALGLELPSPSKLIKIVENKPFEGRVLADWLKRTQAIDIERITGAVKQGLVDGVTPTQLVRQIFGKGLRGPDGVTHKAFRDMESVLLTATSQVQNDARQELYDENGDLFDEEYFVATLDVKTTFECAGNDGKTFKRRTGPMPPLHFRCRSLRVPYIGESIFNKRGFDSSTQSQLLREYAEETGLRGVKSRDDLPRGTKTKYDAFARKRARELMGQVPAKTNFNTFLKNQTPEFQNEYLGLKRAEMFREGKFQLNQFVSPTGRNYTLEELGI